MSTETIIDKTLRVESSWNYIAGYACRACGDIARVHPQTNWIWGCLKCHFTTAAVSVYFAPLSESALSLGLSFHNGREP